MIKLTPTHSTFPPPRSKTTIEGSSDQPVSSDRSDRKNTKSKSASGVGVGVGVAETAQQVAQAAQDDKALKVGFQLKNMKQ